MKGTLGSVLFSVFATAAIAQGDRDRTFDLEAAFAKVEKVFRDGCKQNDVVGASLAFVRGGAIAKAAHFGSLDRDSGRMVDEGTIFHWASCTKTLTGIAVMQLRDRARLSLEQPVVDFVPELLRAHDPHGVVRSIQLRHVMQHAAGLRGRTFPWGGSEPWHPHEPTDWDQLVAMMPYTSIDAVPGTAFSYSNLGIVLLGRAIEQLSGEDYEVHLDKNVLRPLGMRDSYFDVTPYHLQARRSHAFEKQMRGLVVDRGPDFDTGVTVSNCGLNAPIADMARYVAFLCGDLPAPDGAPPVLERASLEEMWVPSLPVGASGESIGLCFFVQEHAGHRVATHTGGQRGFVSFFYVHPDSGTGALAAFNTGTAGPVMADVRKACIELLSTPLARESKEPENDARWQRYSLKVDRPAGKPHRVVLTAPTGGHEFHYERTSLDGEFADVELKLVTPGAEEVVVQALDELSVEIPAKDLGAARRVRLRIAAWQRGVQYFAEPKHELAATLRLP